MTIFDRFGLRDRVAVVTGGGGLLGFEFCKTLAEAGGAVVVADLNVELARKTANHLTDNGYSAFAYPLDVTCRDSSQELVAEIKKQFGRLDILVNSAALDPKFDLDAVFHYSELAGSSGGLYERGRAFFQEMGRWGPVLRKTTNALGAGALAMTTVGFGASYLKAVFFADNLVLNAFFFFLGKWVFDIIYFVGEQRVHGVELVQQLLLWSPLSAAVTAAVGVLLLFIMRPLLEPSPA